MEKYVRLVNLDLMKARPVLNMEFKMNGTV